MGLTKSLPTGGAVTAEEFPETNAMSFGVHAIATEGAFVTFGL